MMEKRTRFTPEMVSSLAEDEIFVFGSNIKGYHAGGAARTALKWGAVMGQGVGLQGQTYAIPTMYASEEEIKPYINDFIEFAGSHPEKRFLVTEIGCGIAGFTPKQIAPLFLPVLRQKIDNVCLPRAFWEILTSIEGIGKE